MTHKYNTGKDPGDPGVGDQCPQEAYVCGSRFFFGHF